MARKLTVHALLTTLQSKLIAYDKRCMTKDSNIYRLGHLLAANERVQTDMAGRLDSTDTADMARLITALHTRFEVGFSPSEYVARMASKNA